MLFLAAFVTQKASAQLNLNFGTNYTKISNTKYLYTSVNDTLDCIVNATVYGGAVLYSFDDNSGTNGGTIARFQPIITVAQNDKNDSYVKFNFQLIKKNSYNTSSGNGTNIIPSDPVWFRAYDIDGDGVTNGTQEFVEVSSVFTGSWVDNSSQLVSRASVLGGTAYTISNSTINGDQISDLGTLAFNGFIYSNTVSSWDIVGGAYVGANIPDPSKGIDAGDRLNSWSFNYKEVIPGIDFGDAPATYNIPTGGSGTIIPAYHIVPSDASKITVYLGSNKPDVDYDPSGNVAGTVDDNNAITDDEDAFQSTYFPKYAGSGTYSCIVSATNTSGANAYIYGYIDFNGDGTYDPIKERSALITVPSNAGAKQYFTATFSGAFTYTAASNNRYARFRIAKLTADVDMPTGAAASGEVEDYRFNTAMKISGTVYNDANGITDNLINGTGKAAMGTSQLYAILVDTAGKVLQSVAVKSDGTYLLDSAGTNNTFKVLVSTTNPKYGTKPTTLNTLPTGYVYTSEGITSTIAAGDKLAAGNFSTTTAITDVVKMDFGWNALPETDAKTLAAINSPNTTTKYSLLATPLSGSDPEVTGAISTGGTFIIKTIPLVTDATLYYDNVAVTAGYKILSYDPTKLSIKFAKAGAKSFTYSTVDAAEMEDPTPATYSIPSNSVLPLNDIVLSANLQNGVVKLTLVAKDENQVARYTWEQSTNGTTFTSIGSTAYQATNTSSNVYGFSTTPTGTDNVVYFRSVQYSLDGKTLISNTVTVKLKETAIAQAIAMPTVVKDVTNIKISSAITQTISLNIVDNAGRMVMKKQTTLSAGTNTFAIDGFNKLANGAYYIQIVGVSDQSVLKIMVQH